jgi:serine/threonine protein kinase
MTKDLIGQQLGNYRLVSLLGHGGFAEVYLGQHIRLSMQATIKVLHAHLSDEQVQGFQQEAETIAKLVHPHIVRVLDFDVTNEGIPFLVMDYCANGTLRKQYVKGERVSPLTVVSYVQQVADALQYAHDQKIIHRDVKPENMLIGQRNDILPSDFGIASTAHSTSSMSTQIPVGTIPYMAPEQIQAQARPASDQYALGIIVYEWLCGTRPFEGSYTEIFAKHLMTPPPPLRQKMPDLPPDVEQVVLTALAKDPHQRFATVQAFATTLEQASQTKPSVAAPPQRNTAPSRSTPPPPSTAPTPPMTSVQTPIEVDMQVAQPLPPTITAMAEQPHTQAKLHTPVVSSPMPKQSSSASSVPRHKIINFTIMSNDMLSNVIFGAAGGILGGGAFGGGIGAVLGIVLGAVLGTIGRRIGGIPVTIGAKTIKAVTRGTFGGAVAGGIGGLIAKGPVEVFPGALLGLALGAYAGLVTLLVIELSLTVILGIKMLIAVLIRLLVKSMYNAKILLLLIIDFFEKEH